ncbi:SGNH/GDSL hydrolase family protein [Flavobacterium sp.]|uniref:SGNH/GDSL hydrolase family protein n=1 Tax=Flavobacterium sp. TaxID=239 RepID=UPI002639BC60|nr:SGNH/GDSL hydrolase family protein [Flavobacterium sp.]
MIKYFKIILLLFYGLFLTSCSVSEDKVSGQNPTTKTIKYLALGDSYTIGQSVCESCRFPIQLQDSIKKSFQPNDVFITNIIAQTGWTTANLKAAIASQNPSNDYDLVTLLIGVNNQFQNRPFSIYEQEFPELVNIAIEKAKGVKNRVIVVSIPDYAYTPFGNGNTTISTQIDAYNTFAQNYCTQNNITFINITDITRLGLQQPNLVANDGLHPSQLAYKKFVERIYPAVKIKLGF